MLATDFYERSDEKGICHRDAGVRGDLDGFVPLGSGECAAETAHSAAAAVTAAADELRQAAAASDSPTSGYDAVLASAAAEPRTAELSG